MSGARRWLVLAVLSLAVLLIAIDATVLNLAIPAIAADLDPTATQMLWILDVYSLVLAGLLISAGTLSDRLGRKRVLLAGCALFGVASALAAFASTPEQLIAARVLLGIGGATIMPSTLALIRVTFDDPRERTFAIGVWSAMAAAGAALGPIVGGALLEHFWWGSVFLVNVPVMVVLLVVGARVLPSQPGTSTGPWDWVGAVTSMVGLVALVLAIKELAAHGISAQTLVAAAVAVLALSLFVFRQHHTAHPLIDLSLFRRLPFTGAVLGNLVALFALSGLLLFVSQLLQLVEGYSPLGAGIRLLPLTVGALLGAPLTARLTQRVGYRSTISGALVASAIGMVVFAFTVGDGYWPIALALIVIGCGVGIALTATSDAIVSSAPVARSGAASSISETAYELGTGLGIAVLGSVLAALYASALGDVPGLSADDRGSLAATLQAAAELPDAAASALVDAASTAFVDALRTTALVACALLGGAAILTGTLLRQSREGALA